MWSMKNQEKEDFAARLNEICDDLHIPPKGHNRQGEAAKVFGLTQKGVRKWLEAEGFPSMGNCISIAKKGKVYFEWLMTGRPPKRYKVVFDISEEALAVGKTWERLSKNQRIHVLTQMDYAINYEPDEVPYTKENAARYAALIEKIRKNAQNPGNEK